MSTPLTEETIRLQFIHYINVLVDYWANIPGVDTAARCDGVAFAILTTLDGRTALPRFTVAAQMPDGDEVVINDDCDLYDAYAAASGKDHPRVVIEKP
jgi:hypothetical protein